MDKLALEGGRPVAEKLIPIAHPVFSETEIEEVVKVLRSGEVRQGPRVEEFEKKFADKVGSKYAYAVSSGTAALHVAYLSVLHPGDEIIVPAFTFIATASAAAFVGAKPVFADIDKDTFVIDPEDVERKITRRTKAIAPVHLFGNSADMNALRKIAQAHDLILISDIAQAHGTRYDGKDVGSFDTLNCYSFYPTKNMTTGEGGMVTTNSKELYEKGRLLRSHGQSAKYYHTVLGLNYRLTDIAAVIGIKQLENLDGNIRKRRKNAEFLSNGLRHVNGIQTPQIREGVIHSFHQYSVVMDTRRFSVSRDEFIKALQAENIGCAVHYPVPLTKQPVFKEYACPCPVAEETSERIFSLPVYPLLGEEELQKIVDGVKKVAARYSRTG